MTLDLFSNRLQGKQENTIPQEYQLLQSPNLARLGQKCIKLEALIKSGASRKRRGDVAEAFAEYQALLRGFEVHRNISSVGLVDMVFVIDDVPYLIDAKLAKWEDNGDGTYRWKAKNCQYVKQPIWPLVVVPENTGWFCAWPNAPRVPSRGGNVDTIKLYCPPGLERCWDG